VNDPPSDLDPSLEVLLTEAELVAFRPLLEALDSLGSALVDALQRGTSFDAGEMLQYHLQRTFVDGQVRGALATLIRLRGEDPAARWLRSPVNPSAVITVDFPSTVTGRSVDPRWQS
jgi:hypothetical protein